jgi:hypothetical protein
MARNRVIYQSQALFLAPSATGVQVSGITAAGTGPTTYSTVAGATAPLSTGSLASGISLLKKLDRIQSLNFNFTINRKDINEFGKLSRLDSIVVESPTVGLDFDFYVTDGFNERLLGFNMYDSRDSQTIQGTQAISGLIADTQGNNYYITTFDEGEDVVGGSLKPTTTVVAIGNGFINEYSFDATVGQIPKASIKVEAFNIKSDYADTPVTLTAGASPAGTVGADILTITGNSPAINILSSPVVKYSDVGSAYKIDQYRNFTGAGYAGTNSSGLFTTGTSLITALRPGDLSLTLSNLTDTFNDLGTSHIQSFKFTLPLKRTILQRLGNTFGFARIIDVPINMDFTISAIVSELRSQNVYDQLGSPIKKNMTVTLNDPNGTPKLSFGLSGAIFKSESFSEGLGDNQKVDFTYGIQIGGSNDTANGLFMSGSYGASTDAITSGYFKLGTGKL